MHKLYQPLGDRKPEPDTLMILDEHLPELLEIGKKIGHVILKKTAAGITDRTAENNIVTYNFSVYENGYVSMHGKFYRIAYQIHEYLRKPKLVSNEPELLGTIELDGEIQPFLLGFKHEKIDYDLP